MLDVTGNISCSPMGSSSSKLYIGARYLDGGATWPYKGKMDNLIIYNCVKKIEFQVLQYNFEGNPDSWLHDRCIYYDHAGTPHGGPTCSQAQITNSFGYSVDDNGSKDYHSGHSLYLSAYGSYVDVGSYSELSISGDLTIEARVKLPAASSGTETIVSNNGNYWLGIQVDSSPEFPDFIREMAIHLGYSRGQWNFSELDKNILEWGSTSNRKHESPPTSGHHPYIYRLHV
jgi:hypothetical protein